MPDFRRYYQPNSIVFITSVTKDRFPFLRADDDVKLFIETARKVEEIHPFNLLAYVILPDHFHWLMRTVDLEGNFSKILHSVKRNFSLNYKAAHQIEEPIRLWQPRFWDHVIRSERDLSLHFDYIHWNPVKHGYVRQPEEWVHSTVDFWFQRGFYPVNWSNNGEPGDLQGLVLE
jgi:putative transposase